MDLCLRARNDGIRTFFHPDLTVVHTGRHSVESEPFEALARNRRDVIERTLGHHARGGWTTPPRRSRSPPAPSSSAASASAGSSRRS